MQNQEGQPIYLSVVLPGSYQTKVPYQGTLPTTANPLHVDVWASTTSRAFKDDDKDGSKGEVAIHTTGSFQSGEPQLLSQAIYPPPRRESSGTYTADPVYFVAMYPQSVVIDPPSGTNVWNATDDGTKATYTFTGCEDVMYAPEVYGAYDVEEQTQIVTKSPKLKFDHLLTRFTVKMGLELEEGEAILDAKEAWGKIKSLRIQSYNKAGDYGENLNQVTIDLSKGQEFDYGQDVSYEGIPGESMSFYVLGTNDTFPSGEGYELTEQIDSVAYVMCAPVVDSASDSDYVIIFETEKRERQELIIDLEKTIKPSDTEEGSTRGNHFVITLKFKKGRAIASVVNVAPWENGGYGSGDIND